jgi:NTP pyrophosphohydrolases including oxidative damage repair enzymes
MNTASNTGVTELAAGRFVSLKVISWTDAHGVARKWESAERVNNSGAVLIIPLLEPSGRIALIRQFRPPAGRAVIEFPAGLVDAGEDPETAARRELREETGYIASRMEIHPPAYTTPGLSNESVYMAKAFIDEETPDNRNPRTDFDSSEMIDTILLPHNELLRFYREETAKGVAFDAKLAAYILGLPTPA